VFRVFVVILLADARFGFLRKLWPFRRRTAVEAPETEGLGVRRPAHEFHVVKNEVRVTFEVPLPEGGADEVLRDLLLHHVADMVRDRERRGQPLAGIKIARAYAKRDGEAVEVGSINLELPEELARIQMPELVLSAATEQHDPLRRLGDTDMRRVAPIAETTRLDELAPIGDEIKLTAGLEAGLRSLGIDPGRMTATQLGLGLLELAGYTVQPRPDDRYLAAGGGRTTYVAFLDHEPGSYPEMEEQVMSEFLVGFASARTDRGLLITDKYGPYGIYEKERANPRCHFITRERMQAFVDSIALS
jgi:hypothetical protein